MRRIVFFSGVVSFAMAFLGTLAASTLAVPMVVGAQEARIRAEQLTIVGDNGADRINLITRPGVNSEVQVADTNGIRRASFNTGGFTFGNDPDASGFNIWAPNGATSVMRLGMGRGPAGDQPLTTRLSLSDQQGQPRILLLLAEDGTPSIRMLDASGTVTWDAK